MEFQNANGLRADGIVGPVTQAKLNGVRPGDRRTGIQCGNSDAGILNQAQQIRAAFFSELSGSPRGSQAFGITGGSPTFGSISLPSLPSFQKLDATQTGFAIGAFGTSIDLSRVFISNKLGPTGRPFTAFIGAPVGLATQFGICVMNLGKFATDKKTVIHELAHVWQSQHAANPATFMQNCLGSQTQAAAENGVLVTALPDIRKHDDFPSDFPMSAYSFVPGKPSFSDYAGEQIAYQVEKGIAAIVTHVKSVSAGTIDTENNKSLQTIRTQDRRAAGVVE
jgi:hypothetical protein